MRAQNRMRAGGQRIYFAVVIPRSVDGIPMPKPFLPRTRTNAVDPGRRRSEARVSVVSITARSASPGRLPASTIQLAAWQPKVEGSHRTTVDATSVASGTGPRHVISGSSGGLPHASVVKATSCDGGPVPAAFCAVMRAK